ncbi:MAG TPA: hypothetical protein VK610_07305, partial [Rhodothermales bacterium]|nr:hypothetical protein [Rhodothermales bacterium]
LTDNANQTSDLTGNYRVEGRGIDPDALALTASLDLDRSSYTLRPADGGDPTTYALAGADVELMLRGGRLTYDGTLQTDGGGVTLVGEGRPFDETPTLAFREGTRFTNLDLGTLLGRDSLQTNLNGTFVGDVAGFAPQTMRAGGALRLGPSTVNGTPITRGEADFILSGGLLTATALAALDGETSTLDLDGDGKPDDAQAGMEASPGGRVAVTFTGRLFDAEPTYALRGTLERLDLAALLGRPSDRPTRITGKVDLTGAGFALDSARAAGSFSLNRSVVAGVRLDTLTSAFALDGGALVLDTLLLRSDLADATGGGRINLTGELPAGATAFHLTADLKDPEALDEILGRELVLGRGTVAVDLHGEPGQPIAMEATAEAERFAAGPIALTNFDTRVSGTFDPRSGELQLSTQIAFDLLSTPTLLIERGDLQIEFDGDTLSAQGSVLVDRRRDLAFFVRASLSDPENAVYLDQAGFTLEGETWRLARPATISYGDAANRRYRVRNLLLISDSGQSIAADGVIDPQGEQSLIVSAENVQIDALTDLVGFEGLGGRLSTSLSLSGPAQAPLIDGTLRIDSLTSQRQVVGSLDTRVTFAARRLNLDAVLTHTSGQTLTATGYLPLRFSLAPADSLAPNVDPANPNDGVRFSIRAQQFPISWVQPFLNPEAYSTIGGELTIPDSITVTGTQSNPQLGGRAVLTGGRLGVVATGRVYETISAPVSFEGNRIELDGTTITDPESGEITLRVDGGITLRELSLGELDLTIRPNGFLAITNPTYRRLILDGGPEPIHLT